MTKSSKRETNWDNFWEDGEIKKFYKEIGKMEDKTGGNGVKRKVSFSGWTNTRNDYFE